MNPFGAGQGLALGTVAVGARVEPDALLAATVTHFHVTAQSSGAATFNGSHHAAMSRG